MNNRKIFTSESVTQGHPDKLCDLVSDSVLDAVLEQDPMGRVACETAATTGMVLVMGEITTSARIDIAQIARKAICDAGYDRPEMGFDGHSCNVMVAMGRQSPDIAMGVDNAYDDGTTGAGDQGMMFGFACTQTKELMPAPIAYAHNLTKALTHARESGLLPWLRPDGKSQVSVEYGPDGLPARIDTVVVSTQHADSIAIDDLRRAVIETVIEPNLPSRLLDENTKYYVNPTGRFVIGGPAGDSGLTGRKIIVDTYGGYAAHGGGAFSGKDPTKVDRSGAYMARYIAKNLVAAGLADVVTDAAGHPAPSLTRNIARGWERLLVRIGLSAGEQLPADRNILHTEGEERELLRRSAAAVRQAQQRVVPTQTRPREDPSYGDLVRTANQRAYSEDAKRLRNM